MPKTLDDNFRDWENDTFGYGYGSGEPHILPVLKRFLELCPSEGAYKYEALEKELGPVSTWLLINVLCHRDILEYGSSPRNGWLTDCGRILKSYTASKTIEELFSVIFDRESGYYECFPDYCNYNPDGLSAPCPNPFWQKELAYKMVQSERKVTVIDDPNISYIGDLQGWVA